MGWAALGTFFTLSVVYPFPPDFPLVLMTVDSDPQITIIHIAHQLPDSEIPYTVNVLAHATLFESIALGINISPLTL